MKLKNSLAFYFIKLLILFFNYLKIDTNPDQLTFTFSKVNNKNTRKKFQICQKLTIKSLE